MTWPFLDKSHFAPQNVSVAFIESYGIFVAGEGVQPNARIPACPSKGFAEPHQRPPVTAALALWSNRQGMKDQSPAIAILPGCRAPFGQLRFIQNNHTLDALLVGQDKEASIRN